MAVRLRTSRYLQRENSLLDLLHLALCRLNSIVHATMPRMIIREVALGVAHIRHSTLDVTELVGLSSKVRDTKGSSDRWWVE